MNLRLTPAHLTGSITPPPSKSQAHRLLIAAALADGTSHIAGLGRSRDISATISCLTALGAVCSEDGTVRGIGVRRESGIPVMDCCESGSTLRFLIPVSLAVAGGGEFHGRGRLMERPQEPYFAIFREKGIAFSRGDGTLTVTGRLRPSIYSLPGNVSSQFVTGLLYALPMLGGDSEIVLTSPLESAGYVEMTMDALARFGVTVRRTDYGYAVPGCQRCRAFDAAVEPDYSQAAFFLAANGLGNDLTVTGLNPRSHQGDRIILPYEEKLDAAGTVTLDVRECPDLLPALALRAALRDGETTHLVGAGRLRLKESDRLRSVTDVLTALGADIDELPEALTIRGVSELSGGVTVDAWGDHRIAMMTGIAATRCRLPVTLTGAESVEKSYPGFWGDYRALGGIWEEIP